jgi:translation initiation factor 1
VKEKPVYSTAGGDQRKASGGKGQSDAYVRGTGPMKMRLETGGRGGKAVTVLFNLPYANEDEARTAMRAMQERFGCGATLKGATIELRGDVRTKVEAYVQASGQKVVRAGG